MEQPFNIRMTCALSLRRPMQTRYDCTRGVKRQTKTASITGNARGPGSMSELSKRYNNLSVVSIAEGALTRNLHNDLGIAWKQPRLIVV
jgi:hypothetical protein